MMLTAERLRELYHYNRETGEFTRLQSKRRWEAGQRAGTISHGYVRINCDHVIYYGHRLAWLYVYGEWPAAEIDHINRDRADNRWANLRRATRVQNGANLPRKSNNTSGVPGVSFDKRDRRWMAYINPGRRKLHLGSFSSFDDAVRARKVAEAHHFSEFAPRL